jgi:hypothetical protein
MRHTRTAITTSLLAVLAIAAGTASSACVHKEVIYMEPTAVPPPHGGGPVHGAVHGAQCLEHAATLRGCD